MQFKATFQGKRINKEWSYFAWLISINGETFEYRTGLGHATPIEKRDKKGFYKGMNKKPQDIECLFIDDEWIHIPSIDSVLECLFLDADAGEYSFDDFCDNLDYSTDSLKALDTYRACMETSKKLHRALGKEFQAEKKRIEQLNQ